MSLVFLTGGVRSGKSAAAVELAASRGKPVVVLATGCDEGEEMARRVEKHRRERPSGWRVIEPRPGSWFEGVSENECAVFDCLGGAVSSLLAGLPLEESVTAAAEEQGLRRVKALMEAITQRSGDTIVVSNEVGSGLVPPYPSGRLFRDLMGMANRVMAGRADAAWLCVTGRYIDLKALPEALSWPEEDE